MDIQSVKSDPSHNANSRILMSCAVVRQSEWQYINANSHAKRGVVLNTFFVFFKIKSKKKKKKCTADFHILKY